MPKIRAKHLFPKLPTSHNWVDLQSFNYDRAPGVALRGVRDPCVERVIFFQAASGAIYSMRARCRSKHCSICGPEYRRKLVERIARCLAPFDCLYMAEVPQHRWSATKRALQRGGYCYVALTHFTHSRAVVATGCLPGTDLWREIDRIAAIEYILEKLRRPDLLARRAFSTCQGWSGDPVDKGPPSQRLGRAPDGVTENDVLGVASEIHEAGGGLPVRTRRPPADLSNPEFALLIGKALDECWRRARARPERRT